MISNLTPAYQAIYNSFATKHNSLKSFARGKSRTNLSQQDVFNKSYPLISFKGNEGPSQKTLNYIEKTREAYKKKYYKYPEKLETFDLKKMLDICKGISVFDGWSAEDLAFVTNNIESILIQRGCSHQCTHCGVCSQHKISTINWDNYIDFVEGAGEITRRLGFNPFKITSCLPNYFMLFNDSEPMHFSSYDSKGVRHNFFDAARLYYEKTKTPVLLTTAGWEKGNDNAQKAAEMFVKHPEYIASFCISIHPFHAYMARSSNFLEQGDIKRAEYWRNKYIHMMANVIKTTYPLKFNNINYGFIFEYAPDNNNPYCTQEEMTKLAHDIIAKVEEQGLKLDYTFLSKFSNINFPRRIIIKGRAQSLKGESIKDKYYPIDKSNRFMLSSNDLSWDYKYTTPGEILSATKIIDTDGSILIKKKNPGIIDINFAKLPLKLNFKHPTDWRSEYNYGEIPENNLPQLFKKKL